MPACKVATIILAAGASQRFGSPKQLALYRGRSLIEHVCTIAKETLRGPAVAILGQQYSTLKGIVSTYGITPVEHTTWASGQGSSVARGVQEIKNIDPGCHGFLFLLCDQPAVTVGHIKRLMDLFAANPDAVIMSRDQNHCGAPGIFPRRFTRALINLSGDQGAKSILQKKDHVITVSANNELVDIDRPEDLQNLIEAAAARGNNAYRIG